jgi:hypothetical protein
MTEKELLEEGFSIVEPLFVRPPFIWPESRVHAGVADYIEKPPGRQLLIDADLISGLLVGVDDETIKWLDELLRSGDKIRIYLVLVLFPAGPTRAEHLRAIDMLGATYEGTEKTLGIRLLPIDEHFERDFKRMNLPPTVIQAHNAKTGRTVMTIGSVGDAGHDSFSVGSLNFVFQPDDAMRDVWRRWFQYCFSSAARMTGDTLQIPHLIPAKGDPEATQLWLEFQKACRALKSTDQSGPTVDPKTGEILTDKNGEKVAAWDEGVTALDPLAQLFQQVYASGWLVTVDEATRIKPLTIPVKATLMGQQSERTVGALKQKQSFTLQVLDDDVDKAIEKCRKVTDVMELLTFPLSQGNRWLPDTAKGILEKELETRNEQGRKALRAALGGNDIKQFISNRAERIRKDLNEMYRQLGQGKAVPEDKLKAVLDEVERRLTQALDARITPRAVYNSIGAPDLTARAPDENWNQPLALLTRSARMLRESLTDHYFQRRFSGLSFSDADFRKACDVFDDVLAKQPDSGRAKAELDLMDDLLESGLPSKGKCLGIWQIITGAPPRPEQ